MPKLALRYRVAQRGGVESATSGVPFAVVSDAANDHVAHVGVAVVARSKGLDEVLPLGQKHRVAGNGDFFALVPTGVLQRVELAACGCQPIYRTVDACVYRKAADFTLGMGYGYRLVNICPDTVSFRRLDIAPVSSNSDAFNVWQVQGFDIPQPSSL